MTAGHDVVVGLDGSTSGWRALDWAAEQAESAAAGLVLVHVRPDPSDAEPHQAGAEVLARAVARVADDRPGVRTTARLGSGRPDRALLDGLDASNLVVVGRGGHRASTVHLGATARRVLAHAPCPTIVVGGTDCMGADSVVVGVSGSRGGLAAMRFAGGQARARGWELVAVRGADEQWPPVHDAAVLAAWVARAREEYPDVDLRPVLSPRPADQAVECEAMDAGLVVLGCHRADTVKVGRLGVLTSALAREVSCPVAVVGHPADAHARGRRQGDVPASAFTQASTGLPTTSGR